jgi:hypothetical protein
MFRRGGGKKPGRHNENEEANANRPARPPDTKQ